MPEDNRFDGIADQLGDSDADADTKDSNANESVAAEGPTNSPGSVTANSKSVSTAVEAKETQAFDFDTAQQGPLYPREETWQDFEDVLDFEVRKPLRDADYKDIEKRELHEATLRVAIENPDLIVEKLKTLRNEQVRGD